MIEVLIGSKIKLSDVDNLVRAQCVPTHAYPYLQITFVELCTVSAVQ